MRKTKLPDLYCLSFTESMDTLKALDRENAEVVRIFSEYENPANNIHEISHRASVSLYNIRKLVYIKSLHDDGIDVLKHGYKKAHANISNKLILNLVKQGRTCADIARAAGTHSTTIHNRLEEMGYKYNSRLDKWVNITCHEIGKL